MTSIERRILVLPATGTDGAAMTKLFAAAGLEAGVFRSGAQLCAAYRDGAGTLIVAEESLTAEPEELFKTMGSQPVWSDIPLIVLSRAGRESLSLAEIVPRLGNVSVVERPIRTTTLLSLVRSNLRARDRQYQVREYLVQQVASQKVILGGERRYRSLVENINDYAILMTDLAGTINSWNKGAEQIFGFSGRELHGISIDTFSTAEDASVGLLRQELDEATRSGRAAAARWRVRADGRRIYTESVSVSVPDDSGTGLGVAHFLRDVTERHERDQERENLLLSERAARSEAERTGRMKDEFLATLSHELRTPLNAVIGWSQVLRRIPNLSADVLNGVGVIERNARAQAKIIEDLLDMSSIISGKVRLDVQSLDIGVVINATVEAVRPAAVAKGIQLAVVLDPLVAEIRGDPSRLRQVMWNLLTNAIKFTAKGGQVTVTLARVGSHLEIEVSDTGEGIEPQFLPHVFDRFRQADATTTRRHGGLGLGLSIVKQLVELHGGSISANSAGKGLGSTFRLNLAVTPILSDSSIRDSTRQHPRQAAADPTLEGFTTTNLVGLKILVVDDEPDARSLLQRLLGDCNADAVAASSVPEAMQLLERESPDLMVSDIGMPGEDGYSLIRRVRRLGNRNAEIPAIALTAYARVEDRVRALQAGFQAHLAKPVEPAEFIAMIASLTNRPVAELPGTTQN